MTCQLRLIIRHQPTDSMCPYTSMHTTGTLIRLVIITLNYPITLKKKQTKKTFWKY